jgi:hypothetical protein
VSGPAGSGGTQPARRRPSRGATGGAANEAGSEFRRGVAAHAAAHGLAGVPLLGFGFGPADAHVETVSCETDAHVDDIKLVFSRGHVAYIQAKRSLNMGAPLRNAVAQWRGAVLTGALDPARHRLVIASQTLSGTARTLQGVLERHKRIAPGSWTKAEQEALDNLLAMLPGLTPAQQDLILQCAIIVELKVEDDTGADSRAAISALSTVLQATSPRAAEDCWTLLRADAGLMARQRAGDSISNLVAILSSHGALFHANSSTPAGAAWLTKEAMDRYTGRIRLDGSRLELRGLGANVPALDLADVDVQVGVGVKDDRDDSSTLDLLWAFVRRGRAVLSGLPGSGKSTSARRLASRLLDVAHAPLPIVVSLRDVDAGDRQLSMRDRIVATALAAESPADRPALAEELNRLLDHGGAALILDALDETYERRGSVVAELERMLATISRDVDVLLVTRDAAYGQAETLGWKQLAQGKPKDSARLVAHVLAASDSGLDEAAIKRKAAWVKRVLAQNDSLNETPLVPVLLALLAVERDEAALPHSRAETLAEVVEDVIERYEVSRRPDAPLGNLTQTQIVDGLLHAFSVAASCVLDHRGQAPETEVLRAIADQSALHWGLAPGQAASVARDALNFFDESGIFIKSADRKISARIALFSEVGAAIGAAHLPGEALVSWVTSLVATGQVEPLILASVLHRPVADLFVAKAIEPTGDATADIASLRAVARAHKDGAPIGEEALRLTRDRFIEEFAAGGVTPWRLLADILELPLEGARTAIETAAKNYDDSRRVLIKARLDMRTRSAEELRTDPTSLLALLRLDRLPAFPRTATISKRNSWTHLTGNRALVDAQVEAARILVGHNDEATQECVRRASLDRSGHDGFRAILREHAVEFSAPKLPESFASVAKRWMQAYDSRASFKLLDAIVDAAARQSAAAAPRTIELTYPQRTRLDELATFVATLNMNDAGSHGMFKHADLVSEIVAVFCVLFDFDLQLLARQAEIVQGRLEGNEETQDPFYALFYGAEPMDEEIADWARVPDIESAVAVLRHMMTLQMPHAYAACLAVWGCHGGPAEGPVTDMLRELMPRLKTSSQHYELVAHTLGAVTGGAEFVVFASSSEPADRRVAADVQDLGPDGRLSRTHLDLIKDRDGHVREHALDAAAKLRPDDLEHVLTAASGRPDPGWECVHCGTQHDADYVAELPVIETSVTYGSGRGEICSKPGCRHKGPRPAHHAGDLLGQLRDEAETS